LHEAGLTHGQICAENILTTARGPVLAPPVLDAPGGLITRSLGWRNLVTIDPDLLRGEAPSRSSDVWALGATLHGLLSPQPLYPGIERDPTVTAVQRMLFARPEVDAALPGRLGDAVAACVNSDPAVRPQTAEELAAWLELDAILA
jgi:serine/threonine protein kinase